MTLIEVLASLALLGSVLMGAAWWVRAAADAGIRFDRKVEIDRSVAAVFDAIDCDLAIGDDGPSGNTGARAPKVEVKDGGLEVRTRAAAIGSVVDRFDQRGATHELTLATRCVGTTPSGSGRADSPRTLLVGIAAFDPTLDKKAKTLAVALTTDDGKTFERTWSLK